LGEKDDEKERKRRASFTILASIAGLKGESRKKKRCTPVIQRLFSLAAFVWGGLPSKGEDRKEPSTPIETSWSSVVRQTKDLGGLMNVRSQGKEGGCFE